jgi:hypothetical protein
MFLELTKIASRENASELTRIQAIDKMLKVQERRAKLLGLDAPTKIETTATVEVVERQSELGEKIARAKLAVENKERELKGLPPVQPPIPQRNKEVGETDEMSTPKR